MVQEVVCNLSLIYAFFLQSSSHSKIYGLHLGNIKLLVASKKYQCASHNWEIFCACGPFNRKHSSFFLHTEFTYCLIPCVLAIPSQCFHEAPQSPSLYFIYICHPFQSLISFRLGTVLHSLLLGT